MVASMRFDICLVMLCGEQGCVVSEMRQHGRARQQKRHVPAGQHSLVSMLSYEFSAGYHDLRRT
jgi:hypothetical protein